MTLQAWAALLIFLGTIVLAATGKMKTATASLLGASIMVISGLLSSEEAVAAIDHNTVGLLVGMMIVVGILSKSGLFQYLAVKAIKITGGRPLRIFWIISLLTAVLSAFLDNVTTVLLVTPVVLSLCELIAMNPLPLLLMELFASNIGGTATLIGDPPNMIIASVAKFSFNEFLVVLAPVAVVALCAVTAYVGIYYKKELKSDPEAAIRLREVDESRLIVNRPLMIKSVVIIILVLVGFSMHRLLHLEASVVALTAAGILLTISLLDEGTIIHNEVEWPTIIYFISLFIMAGGLRVTGVLEAVSKLLTTVLAGSPLLMLLGVLWISGITCAFINNIAFTAIFVHIIKSMALAAAIPAEPLYWALALGACLGGNGTYFSAAANAVVADFAAKEGIEISFAAFSKIGLRVVFVSLLLSSIALLWIGRGLWM
ncbi:ArsB/NhaD family transporter [Cloacibacillus sp.]|uniref:SLC13 family permease n=1 Tax=Cloacibacillus sp. TaxID=2049023 RepID=UPI0025C0FEE9|nr:ArsB/NhaD family transporter [Cloacibacillus sp.]MCC8058483.1 ArsB/NhaD family transporter [Cloacibacillus sp.]